VGARFIPDRATGYALRAVLLLPALWIGRRMADPKTRREDMFRREEVRAQLLLVALVAGFAAALILAINLLA
jgi:hypothetical protein